jgi:hypothetical protein
MIRLPDVHARDPQGLARYFRYFGEVETPRLHSKVYTAFSLGIAEDEALLDLAAQVDPGQPAPNVLYAAVQDLLLEDPDGSATARDLVRFYPAITGETIPETSPFPAFRAFCLAQADRLLPRLRNGKTQTCVVHRCTAILPALAHLPRVTQAGGRVGLLEIGPGAGLNLRLDRYRYEYLRSGERVACWGQADTTPVLECELRGSALPPLPEALEPVARRGLELEPIDLADPLALRWQRALIWPEHVLRTRLLEQALAHAADVPVEIEQGDATCDLAAAVGRLPTGVPRVVCATAVLYQIPEAGQAAITRELARASEAAPVDFLVMDSTGQGGSRLDHFVYEEGALQARRALANVDSHGRWMEWTEPGRSLGDDA